MLLKYFTWISTKYSKFICSYEMFVIVEIWQLKICKSFAATFWSKRPVQPLKHKARAAINFNSQRISNGKSQTESELRNSKAVPPKSLLQMSISNLDQGCWTNVFSISSNIIDLDIPIYLWRFTTASTICFDCNEFKLSPWCTNNPLCNSDFPTLIFKPEKTRWHSNFCSSFSSRGKKWKICTTQWEWTTFYRAPHWKVKNKSHVHKWWKTLLEWNFITLNVKY